MEALLYAPHEKFNKLIWSCRLAQSTPHQLAFSIEFCPRSIFLLSWYYNQAHPKLLVYPVLVPLLCCPRSSWKVGKEICVPQDYMSLEIIGKLQGNSIMFIMKNSRENMWRIGNQFSSSSNSYHSSNLQDPRIQQSGDGE